MPELHHRSSARADWYHSAPGEGIAGALIEGSYDPATGGQTVDCPHCPATHQHPDGDWQTPDCGGPRYFVITETKEN